MQLCDGQHKFEVDEHILFDLLVGFPDDINRFRPEYAPLLSGMKIQHIDGGQHHSLILDKDGK